MQCHIRSDFRNHLVSMRQVEAGCGRKEAGKVWSGSAPGYPGPGKRRLRAPLSVLNAKDDLRFLFFFKLRHRTSCGYYGGYGARLPPDYPRIVTGGHWPELPGFGNLAPCARLKRDAGGKEAEDEAVKPPGYPRPGKKPPEGVSERLKSTL